MARPRAHTIRVATPERLLDAAEQGFGAAGFAAARLEDIAARAGITRPSLLHHYPAKDELYAAVVERAFATLGARLQAAMAAQGGFTSRLDAIIDAFAGFLEERPAVAALIVREMVDQRGPGGRILVEQASPLLGRVEAFLRRAGRGVVRPGLPLRAALAHTCSGLLLRAAAGPLAEPLWGPGRHSRLLAHKLLIAERRPGGRS